MIEFSHVIADPQGLHARPVTDLAAEALRWPAETRMDVACGDRVASARDLISLMGLGACRGDELRFRIEGPDERGAAAGIQALVRGF